MFSDIHEELENKIGAHHLDHFYWWELVYADDTMLIGKRDREINMLLCFYAQDTRMSLGGFEPGTILRSTRLSIFCSFIA